MDKQGRMKLLLMFSCVCIDVQHEGMPVLLFYKFV